MPKAASCCTPFLSAGFPRPRRLGCLPAFSGATTYPKNVESLVRERADHVHVEPDTGDRHGRQSEADGTGGRTAGYRAWKPTEQSRVRSPGLGSFDKGFDTLRRRRGSVYPGADNPDTRQSRSGCWMYGGVGAGDDRTGRAPLCFAHTSAQIHFRLLPARAQGSPGQWHLPYHHPCYLGTWPQSHTHPLPTLPRRPSATARHHKKHACTDTHQRYSVYTPNYQTASLRSNLPIQRSRRIRHGRKCKQ